MSQKRSSVAQRRPARQKVAKVSVLLPRDIHRKVDQAAKADRRAMSPQIVVLIEEGLAAREAAAA